MIIFDNKRPCIGNWLKKPMIPQPRKSSLTWQLSVRRLPITLRTVIQAGNGLRSEATRRTLDKKIRVGRSLLFNRHLDRRSPKEQLLLSCALASAGLCTCPSQKSLRRIRTMKQNQVSNRPAAWDACRRQPFPVASPAEVSSVSAVILHLKANSDKCFKVCSVADEAQACSFHRSVAS